MTRSSQGPKGEAGSVPDLDAEALLDNLGDCVVFRLVVDTDEDGQARRRLAYVSPSIERLFGLTPHDATADAANFYRLVDPSERERFARLEVEAARTLSRFRADVAFRVLGERRVFTIVSMPRRQPDGTLRWDGLARDVTEREETRATRERLAAMIQASDDYAAIQTVGGRCIFLNEAGRQLRGLADDVDVNSLVIENRHPPEEAERMRREVLPLVLHDGHWSGRSVLRHVDGTLIPVQATLLAHSEGGGRITHLSAVMRDLRERLTAERELREANEEAETALREVNHRVKNLFALVPALIKLSARGKSDVGEVVSSVQDRVMALARSHAMTINAFSQDKGVALDALIRAVLEPYQDRADAFVLDGPAVRLASRDANAMALMLHELATNAAKYGALTSGSGRVVISWRVETAGNGDGPLPEGSGGLLRFGWEEQGGPPVAPPSQAGFGTRLIDRMIERQAGTVVRDWKVDGIRVDVTLPMHGAARA